MHEQRHLRQRHGQLAGQLKRSFMRRKPHIKRIRIKLAHVVQNRVMRHLAPEHILQPVRFGTAENIAEHAIIKTLKRMHGNILPR